MHRQRLIRDLQAYAQRWPDEAMVNQFLQFVQSEPACFERSTQGGHVTASAWIVNPIGTEVLMLHHRKLDKWLQPGGHADGDNDCLKVARKEVREEVGLQDLALVGEIFDIDIHPIPARGSEPTHLHHDVRYALRQTNDDPPQGNHESIELRWFPIAEIADWSEPSLARMAQKWLARDAKAPAT